MKQVFSATCIAAMFAVGLAAQSTGTAGTTGQDPQATGGGQGRGGGPRTVTERSWSTPPTKPSPAPAGPSGPARYVRMDGMRSGSQI